MIYEIKHKRVEEEKVDDINDEDIQYDSKDKNLRRTRRENSVTGA